MIPIVKPFLPSRNEYNTLISEIWKTNILTNNGKYVRRLEEELSSYLNLKDLVFVSNGTIALQLAIKALNLRGEIITTPFSFISTTSSIVWEECKPVFVDIDRRSLNIDPNKIENAITENTSAILATHVYGNPCDIEKIEEIAKKYGLKVIYDGAHAFGVEYKGRSIFEYGDLTTCSTHATKLFHTVEGGFIHAKSKKILGLVRSMINFGFDGPEKFNCLGINGKNSEFHAAMGILNLKLIDQIRNKREKLFLAYIEKLCMSEIEYQQWNMHSKNNHSYFPIILPNEDILLRIMKELEKSQIGSRRYFYPALSNSLPYLEKRDLEVVNDISKRILCLPFYYDLTVNEVDLISKKLNILLGQ